MIHSFLMLGQSNMAGRGEFGTVPELADPSILMLRDSGWVRMREPINPDRPFSGISLAASFAAAYANAYGGQIGLIPCADGGTRLDQWAVGGRLYNRAIERATQAQRDSTIAGILWHQGESDSHSPEEAEAYEGKFTVIMKSLMQELSLEGVPLILGELGEFTGDYKDGACQFFPLVNKALHRIAGTWEHCAIASAAGLASLDDKIHFDARSCRELGLRYFREYQRVKASQSAPNPLGS